MTDSSGTESGETKKIANPEDFKKRVSDVIEQIRPGLQMDGGDIVLVDALDTGEVKVTLTGACAGCPHAEVTLKMGIERFLKEEIPEVSFVTNVEQ